jgi:hypothetical protein
MVTRRQQGGGEDVSGVVRLFRQLDRFGCTVVLYRGGFIGIRGRAGQGRVGQVPAELWRALAVLEPQLRRHLLPELPPFWQRLPGRGRG